MAWHEHGNKNANTMQKRETGRAVAVERERREGDSRRALVVLRPGSGCVFAVLLSFPRYRRGVAMFLPGHAIVMVSPCCAMALPCYCHAVAKSLPCYCHAVPVLLPRSSGSPLERSRPDPTPQPEHADMAGAPGEGPAFSAGGRRPTTHCGVSAPRRFAGGRRVGGRGGSPSRRAEAGGGGRSHHRDEGAAPAASWGWSAHMSPLSMVQARRALVACPRAPGGELPCRTA